ncbi:MAG: CDP-diacylglycerol---glycerol-3-phosphate 3-phosphatidyltransferase [Chloroflexota bacterium]|jgi:CDP-diacylglycerol--glycerol-3-phosphate 3-phosphatidyltransferase|nr:CDP-diacylglycerol---glycerol-3-phosphate 3-phosphatidyltransferase [Chloroflexota bacterium]
MSTSQDNVHDLRRGDPVVPAAVKDAVRAGLSPIVRLAIALHLTPNTITVIGLLITIVASALVAGGWLLVGAAVLTAGSLLDAVDGALARAQGGGTAFGSFLDSTLDRASEAIVYVGIVFWFLGALEAPTLPVLAVFVAMAGSFLVSYAHARAEGIGLSASVGLAPRTERLVLVIAGIAFAGLGYTPILIGSIVLIAALTAATVVQRIWHVWRLSQAATTHSEEY